MKLDLSIKGCIGSKKIYKICNSGRNEYCWKLNSACSIWSCFFFLKLVATKRLLFLGQRSLIKDKTQTAVINILSFCNSLNLTFVCYSTYIFKSYHKCPLKQMTKLHHWTKKWIYQGSQITANVQQIPHLHNFAQEQRLILHQICYPQQ